MKIRLASVVILFMVLALPVLVIADPVTAWNSRALQAIRIDKTAPPEASRMLAILHIAIYDAVNSISGTRNPIHYDPIAIDTPISKSAAVTAAAHRVLSSFYPRQVADLDQALLTEYKQIPESAAKKNGIQLGREIADAILAWRSQDHSNRAITYSRKKGPGVWQPLSSKPALAPQWGLVSCFAISDVSQFRPAPPPNLSSETYARLFADVKRMGQKATRFRSCDQTASALFWDAGRDTTAGAWNAIAREIARQKNLNLDQNAHLFALLNIAIADSAIAVWDCKYTYNFWRPIQAIREADSDGNPMTMSDLNWEPLITTPPHPEYVSAHSALSSAAATVLAAYFGDHVPFEIDPEGEPGKGRAFTSFRQAAEDAGRSRVYGGIHFESANQSGLKLGHEVALYVIQNVAALKKEE